MRSLTVTSPRHARSLLFLGGLIMAACLLSPLVVHRAEATTIRSMSSEEMARSASSIVAGRVISVRPHPLGDIPGSDVTLRVSESFKGSSAAEMTFSVVGGKTAEGLLVEVDGEAHFQEGEDVVVFLEVNAATGRTLVMSGVLGKFGVREGRLVTNGMSLERFGALLRASLAGSGTSALPDFHEWSGDGVSAHAGSKEGMAAAGDAPHVLRVDPPSMGSSADTPQSITIFGRNFGTQPGHVLFPDWFTSIEGRMVSWTDTAITVMAPQPDMWLQVELSSGPLNVVDAWGRSSRATDDPGCVATCHPPSYLYVYYNYPRHHWTTEGNRVSYQINPEGFTGSCSIDALRGAFAIWSANPTSRFQFVDGGTTTAQPGTRDGINTVGRQSPWQFSDSWVAATIPWSLPSGDSMIILEADTGFNTDHWQLSCVPGVYADLDLETVMLHEAGHWLRLRHVGSFDEIMQLASLVSINMHYLGPGDRKGISHIYPSYGSVEAQHDSVVTCPAGDADSIVLAVTALDREGQPRVGLAPSNLWVEADDRSGADDSSRFHASAATDSSGRAIVVLRDLVGGTRSRALRVQAGGVYLADSARFRAFPVDLSGDGRVGSEDLALAADTSSDSWGFPTVEQVRAHLGHYWPGLPDTQPTPPEPPPPQPPSHPAGLRISPNPSLSVTSVVFTAPGPGEARVDLLNLEGKLVRTLWRGALSAGDRAMNWDGRLESGSAAPSGLYLVRARQGSRSFVQKLLRLH